MAKIMDKHLGQQTMEKIATKRLGEEINKLIWRRNVKSLHNTQLDFISNQMAVDFDVLRPFVIHRIGGNVKSCLTVTVKKSFLWMRN
jgi:hypothetical protein